MESRILRRYKEDDDMVSAGWTGAGAGAAEATPSESAPGEAGGGVRR